MDITVQAVAALRARPRFRSAVETYAAASLDGYRARPLIERWMVSDMGRSSISGAISVLEGQGRLTPAALMASRPVTGGEVSRGRARAYLQRAIANDLILAPPGPLAPDTLLTTSPRFRAAMKLILRATLEAAASFWPAVAPALDRMEDEAFYQRVSRGLGKIVVERADLFPIQRPLWLFHGRDGGGRMLEDLISRQRPDRQRLLEDCEVTHSALARASHCSRAHVIQLLIDGEAQGLLRREGRKLIVAPELSEDAERFYAAIFAAAATAAVAALA